MDVALLRKVAPFSLFGFTLAIRLIALWRFSLTPYAEPLTGDMAFYAEWAQRIAAGELTDFQAFYGQPLYAYILGAVFRSVGFEPLFVAAAQAIIDSLTALLIFQISLIVFEDTPRRALVTGIVAGFGWAFFVPAAAYALLLIPASWTAFGWWFAVWWLLRRSEQARAGEWLCLGIAVGIFAMMSATILFVLPLLIARAVMRRAVVAAAAVVAGMLGGTSPAWVHNAFIARDPVFISAHSGVNFWIGNNSEATGYPRVPRELPSEQAPLLRESIATAERAAGRSLQRSEVSRYWSGRAHAFVTEQPADALRLVLVKIKNFWNRFVYDDLSSITTLRDAGVIGPGVPFGLISAFGLGACLVGLQIRRARWIIATVFLQLVALLPVFINERYRMSAAPGLLIMGAGFATEIWRRVASGAWQHVGSYAAVLSACAWFVRLSPGERALWTLDDFKTGKRQLLAGDHSQAEFRLRRAFEPMVPPTDILRAVALTFVESARERQRAGDRSAALALVDQAIRINPADTRLRDLERELAENSDETVESPQ